MERFRWNTTACGSAGQMDDGGDGHEGDRLENWTGSDSDENPEPGLLRRTQLRRDSPALAWRKSKTPGDDSAKTATSPDSPTAGTARQAPCYVAGDTVLQGAKVEPTAFHFWQTQPAAMCKADGLALLHLQYPNDPTKPEG